jgi:ATP-binding cassette, subfamily B, bacterial MsbA
MTMYWRVLRLVRPYLKQILFSVFFMIVFSVLSGVGFLMLIPFLDALFLADPDKVEAGRQAAEAVASEGFSIEALRDDLMGRMTDLLMHGTREDSLRRIVLVFFTIVLIRNIAGYVQFLFTDYVQLSYIRDLRERMYDKFTELPLSYYHRHRAGELMSRATNDVMVMNRCVNMSFTNLSRDPILIVMYLGTAMLMSWRLTLIALVLLPASLLIIMALGKLLRRYSRRQQEAMAVLTARLQETITSIRVIKAFTGEERERAGFRIESRRLWRTVLKMARFQRLSSPLTEQLSMLVGLFILWYGGRQVLSGDSLSPSHFITFLFAVFSLGKPIKELSQVNGAIQEGMAAAERFFEVIDHPLEIDEKPDAVVLGDVKGRLEFRDVRFAYDEADGEVLRGINLIAEPGESIALVGPSGAGKSTLVDLIPRFYDPASGKVLLDDIDLCDLTLQSMRESMGVVTQDVILFNDSILANIAYGCPGARREEIEAAARAANAHEFILRLPRGYETMIGDRGLKLSGGQRQRLSIARAILSNPPVMILDEATSALDTESELLVQEAIDHLMMNRTTFVIAHRLSTIQNVDRICVLEDGKIIQSGTHEELLDEGGLYQHLYDLQFRS